MSRLAWWNVGCLVIAAPLAATGRSFDAAKEFSSTKNPNDPWAYGYSSSAVARDFIPFLDSRTNLVERRKLISWCRDKEQGDGNPSVTRSKALSAVKYSSITQPHGCLNLHPGPEGHRAVVRFTTPESAVYKVQGEFNALDQTTTDPHVLVNGQEAVELKPISKDNRREGFSFIRKLEKGDTLDFAVGHGGNGFSSDSTGLSVTMTTGAGIVVPVLSGSNTVSKAPELDALRRAYWRQSRLLAEGGEQDVAHIKSEYAASLTQLESMVQRRDDLDAVQAIRAEAARQAKDKPPTDQEQAVMPQALLQQRTQYLANLAAVAGHVREKQGQALKQYLSELEKLERLYTQRGNIEGAQILRNERTQLTATLGK